MQFLNSLDSNKSLCSESWVFYIVPACFYFKNCLCSSDHCITICFENSPVEVSEATIITHEQQPVESSSSTPAQDIEPSINELSNFFKFSSYHGGQVAVSHNCRSAVRINPLCEFNNAIVMSHRPLKDDELFEVIVEKLVSRWSGSMEAGL